ncbi:MAG: T9SS type A sorting domain-containing protein [Calditrichaeota bacterium]|nr:T9SS type A sorting domain-containing protein [Calditrichota bacterium]
MKRLLSLLLILVMVTSAIAMNDRQNPEFVKTKAGSQYYPGDPIQNYRSVMPNNEIPEPRPHRDPIEGDRIIVGDTWYDYQTNGSIGKMIFKDNLGAIQLMWMAGENNDLSTCPRSIRYNFSDDDGESWTYEDEGVPVCDRPRGGYGSMWLTNEEEPRAVFFFHQGRDETLFSFCGVDFIYGIGAPINVAAPRYPEQSVIWPQGVVSPENRIHILYNRRDTDMLSYAPGTFDRNGEPVFGDNPIEIERAGQNSYRIAQSPNSERAAMIWTHNRLGFEDLGPWEGYLAWQMNCDMVIAWTEDGEEWNFDEPRNITNCIPPDPRQEGTASYGDTLRPYRTMDIIFDENDFMHVVFDARLLKVQAIEESEPPIDALSLSKSMLYHWSEETDEITPVADGWWDHDLRDEEGNIIRQINPGYWYESTVCRPSLAYAENGALYCVYTIFHRDDYSVHSYCNADVAVTVSEDNGVTWFEPTMITATRTLEAEEGESESEMYPSLAFEIDDFLHISYELDTEPGSTIADYPNREEIVTLCQWYYHKVPVDAIARDEIYDGPPFHVNQRPIISEIDRERGVPITDEPVQITSAVDPNGDREIESVQLEYVIDGDLDNITIIDMNNVDENNYTAEIPGQADGTYVWYRIRAADDEAIESLRPESWWYSYIVRPEGGLVIHDIQYRPPEWTTNDYSPYKDIEVTVTGIVTTPVEFGDEYGGYAIQDSDEFWSGVVIRNAGDLSFGDVVTVTGTVRERDEENPDKWAYMTYIDVGMVDIIGNDDLVEPMEVQIEDLKFNTHAEHLEGMLVRIGSFEIDTINVAPELDGIYLPITDAGEDIENEGWMTTYGLSEDVREELEIGIFGRGTTITHLTGVFVENQTYAIAPRMAEDFGNIEIVIDGVGGDPSIIPEQVTLEPAYPNPFNSITQLGFVLPIKSDVYLAVYDLSGRLVTSIISGEMKAGHHRTSFDAADVSAGVYILKLETDRATVSQKLVLIK